MTCPTCKGEGWLMDDEGQPCPDCTPKDGSTIGGTGVVPNLKDAIIALIESEPTMPGSIWKELGYWRALKSLCYLLRHPFQSQRIAMEYFKGTVVKKIRNMERPK